MNMDPEKSDRIPTGPDNSESVLDSDLITRMTPEQRLQLRLAQNPGTNRYSDVIPFYTNRFRSPESREFYINASILSFDDQVYIASQGPIEKTVADHWEMIWTGEVETIVMLTDLVEGGRSKCFQYWPKPGGESLRTGRYDISCLAEKTVELFNKDQAIVERIFSIKKGLETRTATQLHFQHWPDFGVADTHAVSKLIDLAKEHLTNQHPLLVHCSAGIGRTGMFLAALILDRHIEKSLAENLSKPVVDIAQMISDLRDEEKGRSGMVQTAEQYQAIETVLKFRHGQDLEVKL